MADLQDYWSGLLAFEKAAQSGSFTEAGRQLGLTPSAISKAVARLERRIGTQLFQRSTRSQSLTAEGLAFHRSIAPCLAGLRDAEAALAQPSGIQGELRISAPIDLGRMLIAAWCDDFTTLHPGLRIMLNVTDRLVDVWRDGYDLAIRVGSAPDTKLDVTQIGNLDYAVVASPAYIERQGLPRTPEDIPELDRLAFRTIGGQKMPWTFGKRKLVPGGRLESDDGGALRSAAVSGAGVAYLFRFAVQPDLEDGKLVELFRQLPKPTLPVFAVNPFTAEPPRRVSLFVDFATERLATGEGPTDLAGPHG